MCYCRNKLIFNIMSAAWSAWVRLRITITDDRIIKGSDASHFDVWTEPQRPCRDFLSNIRSCKDAATIVLSNILNRKDSSTFYYIERPEMQSPYYNHHIENSEHQEPAAIIIPNVRNRTDKPWSFFRTARYVQPLLRISIDDGRSQEPNKRCHVSL